MFEMMMKLMKGWKRKGLSMMMALTMMLGMVFSVAGGFVVPMEARAEGEQGITIDVTQPRLINYQNESINRTGMLYCLQQVGDNWFPYVLKSDGTLISPIDDGSEVKYILDSSSQLVQVKFSDSYAMSNYIWTITGGVQQDLSAGVNISGKDGGYPVTLTASGTGVAFNDPYQTVKISGNNWIRIGNNAQSTFIVPNYSGSRLAVSGDSNYYWIFIEADFPDDIPHIESDEKPEGVDTDIESLDKWKKDLEEGKAISGLDKTAAVYDYENRIYEVQLSGEANKPYISRDMQLLFITDVSNSMLYPSGLTSLTPDTEYLLTASGWNDVRTEIEGTTGYDSRHKYYTIADKYNTAIVYIIFYVDSGNQNDGYHEDPGDYVYSFFNTFSQKYNSGTGVSEGYWYEGAGWYYADSSYYAKAVAGADSGNVMYNSKLYGFDSGHYPKRFKQDGSSLDGKDGKFTYYTIYDSNENYLSGMVHIDSLTSVNNLFSNYDGSSLTDEQKEELEGHNRLSYLKKTINETFGELHDIYTAMPGADITAGIIPFAGSSDPVHWNNQMDTDIIPYSAIADGSGWQTTAADDILSAASDITSRDGTRQDVALEFANKGKRINPSNPTNPIYSDVSGITDHWISSDDTDRYVILITDGAPNASGSGNYGDNLTQAQVQANVYDQAEDLKEDRDATLITVGLSMNDVISGSKIMKEIASPYKNDTSQQWFYNAESGEELKYAMRDIIHEITGSADVTATVTDEIDKAFYPVTKDGTPLEPGAKIKLNGDIWDGDPDAQYGVIGYDSTNEVYTVTWNNRISKDGWTGSFYIKAREDFLGGNTINTNNSNATIAANSWISVTDNGSGTPVETNHLITDPDEIAANTFTVETPYVNVNELKLDQHSTDWTVYKGTEVEVRDQLKNLFKNINVEEVVTQTTADKRVPVKTDMIYDSAESDGSDQDHSDTRLIPGAQAETFKITDVWDITDQEINELIASATGKKTHSYTGYGHQSGTLELTLTKDGSSADYADHNATDTEYYTLKLKYIPNDAIEEGSPILDPISGDPVLDPVTSEPLTFTYYTTEGGSPGAETNNMESNNSHQINVFQKGFSLNKVDSAGSKITAGTATFKLWRKPKTGETGEEVPGLSENASDTYISPAGYTGTTSNGELSFSNLEIPEDGIYYLQETAAPAGYDKTQQFAKIRIFTEDTYWAEPAKTTVASKPSGLYGWEQSAKITAAGDPFSYRIVTEDTMDSVSGNTLAINVINPAKLDHSVELNKTNEDGTTVLPGAKFVLEKYNESTETWVGIPNPESPSDGKYTSDANGKINVSGLEPGDYRFIETDAPTGYETDSTPHTFTIGDRPYLILKDYTEVIDQDGNPSYYDAMIPVVPRSDFDLRAYVPTRKFATFAGWSENADGSGTIYAEPPATAQNSQITIPAAGKTLYPVWTREKVKISFETFTDTVIPPMYVTPSTSFSRDELPTNLQNDGNLFEGWYRDSSLQTAVTDPVSVGTDDITLYAKYSTDHVRFDFYLNGGSASRNRSRTLANGYVSRWYQVGDTVTIDSSGTKQFPIPTRDGYVFKGWYENEDFSGSPVTSVTITQAMANEGHKELYAKFVKKPVITFEPNDPDDPGDTDQMQTIANGLSIGDTFDVIGDPAYTTPTKEYYDFKGWYRKSDARVNVTPYPDADKVDSLTIGEEDVCLYARWDPIWYKLTLDENGGNNATGPNVVSEGGSRSVSAPHSRTLTMADFETERTGYTLDGWYDEPDYGNEIESINLTSDKTAYAHWNANTYNITYSGMTGATHGESHPESAVYDAPFTVSNPTKTGYTFTGWNITGMDDTEHICGGATTSSETASGITGTEFKNLRATDGTVTMTATWTPINYTISYELDGGTVAAANRTSYNITTNTFTLNNPTRTGYDFAGWTGTGLSSATTTVTVPVGSTGDRSYTATWTPIDYTISYNLNGGTVATANPTTYNITTNTFTLNNPTKTGYTFAGWTGTGLSGASTSVSIAKGSTGTRSYTATWTAKTYAIAYAGMDGATYGTNHPTTATFDAQFTVNNPTKSGYTFGGWKITNASTDVTHYYDPYTFTGSTLANTTHGNERPTKFKNLRSGGGTVTFTALWEQNPTVSGNQTVPADNDSSTKATFTVTTATSDTYTYKWTYAARNSDGTFGSWTDFGSLPGATSSGQNTKTLTVNPTTTASGGYRIRCRVTNSSTGAIIYTTTRYLYVYSTATSATISPTSRSIQKGKTTTFTVTAAGDGNYTYRWQYRTSSTATWANLTEGTAVGGCTPTNVTSRTLTLAPSTTASSGYQFRCSVTSATGGATASGAGTLTVTN